MKLSEIIKIYGDINIANNKIDTILKLKTIDSIYQLKNGDSYYIVETNGDIHCSKWRSSDDDEWGDYSIEEFDIKSRLQGNVFLTLEEAEFEVEKRKVITTLKKYEFKNPDWKSHTQQKYYIEYNYINDNIAYNCCYRTKSNDIYFESKEVLNKAIKEIGEENVIKYYFEVK